MQRLSKKRIYGDSVTCCHTQKLWFKLAISRSHTMLTPGQPACNSRRLAGAVTRVPMLKSQVRLQRSYRGVIPHLLHSRRKYSFCLLTEREGGGRERGRKREREREGGRREGGREGRRGKEGLERRGEKREGEGEEDREREKRERERERDRQTDRQTDRQRQRQRQTDRQTERNREGDRDRQRDRQTDRQTDKETQRQRQTDRQRALQIGMGEKQGAHSLPAPPPPPPTSSPPQPVPSQPPPPYPPHLPTPVKRKGAVASRRLGRGGGGVESRFNRIKKRRERPTLPAGDRSITAHHENRSARVQGERSSEIAAAID